MWMYLVFPKLIINSLWSESIKIKMFKTKLGVPYLVLKFVLSLVLTKGTIVKFNKKNGT